jgi:hypothetical protein
VNAGHDKLLTGAEKLDLLLAAVWGDKGCDDLGEWPVCLKR